ncbi:sporulation protein [Virgibacillus necropolis]|uniref:Sporulation protein SpoOM n=1 Tax=Virgibacillus necropolis TaxID=163877 RepID=A0A221MHC3_9BACI|nr:sporulation protein [Virgibacillus necropolis]ASN07030.1 sporulation protein SpoOM [Virgibacillus necropolis]
MLKKWLASAGIGNTTVDTQLENDQLIPGNEVKGRVVIQGGNANQEINQINLFVMTEALREVNDRKTYEKVKLDSFTVGTSLTIDEGEKREIDFQFTLPIHTPPTLGKTKVWVQTGLDVPNAVDPKDRDYVTVKSHHNMEAVLEALTNELGFRLRKVEMEYSRRYNHVQEFEFLPGSEFHRDLDELEVMFFLNENHLELILQVDRRAKGLGGLFAEALDMDENFVKIAFTSSQFNEGTSSIAAKLRQTINQFK